MAAHIGDVGVQISGCKSLMEMSFPDNGMAVVAAAGGATAAVAAMRAHGAENKYAALKSMGVISKLVSNDQACAAAVSAGAIEIIVASMRAHFEKGQQEVRLQKVGCDALSKLAKVPTNVPLIVASGGVDAIVAWLQGHHETYEGFDSEEVFWDDDFTSGLRALHEIAAQGDVASRDAVIRAGALEIVAALMQSCVLTSNSQAEGFIIFCFVFDGWSADKYPCPVTTVGINASINAVLAAMRADSHCPGIYDLQALGTTTLTVIAGVSMEGLLAIVAAGAIGLIEAIMTTGRKQVETSPDSLLSQRRQASSVCLRFFQQIACSGVQDLVHSISTADLVRAICGALSEYTDPRGYIQYNGVAFLVKVAGASTEGKELVLKAGGEEIARRAIDWGLLKEKVDLAHELLEVLGVAATEQVPGDDSSGGGCSAELKLALAAAEQAAAAAAVQRAEADAAAARANAAEDAVAHAKAAAAAAEDGWLGGMALAHEASEAFAAERARVMGLAAALALAEKELAALSAEAEASATRAGEAERALGEARLRLARAQAGHEQKMGRMRETDNAQKKKLEEQQRELEQLQKQATEAERRVAEARARLSALAVQQMESEAEALKLKDLATLTAEDATCAVSRGLSKEAELPKAALRAYTLEQVLRIRQQQLDRVHGGSSGGGAVGVQQQQKQEGGVTLNTARLEDYLTDEAFLALLGVPREEFGTLLQWRKDRLKKEKGIF